MADERASKKKHVCVRERESVKRDALSNPDQTRDSTRNTRGYRSSFEAIVAMARTTMMAATATINWTGATTQTSTTGAGAGFEPGLGLGGMSPVRRQL